METKVGNETAKPAGLVAYWAAILALAALIAASWATRKEGGVFAFAALTVWFPAFCVDLCATGRKRILDLATSFLVSAALFPVVWGATVASQGWMNPQGNVLLGLGGPALVYGVWFWARLRRPARFETLRLYRGRLVKTLVWTTVLVTTLGVSCAICVSWTLLALAPVIAVYWAATVALLCAASLLDEKKPNNAERRSTGRTTSPALTPTRATEIE